MSVDRLYWFVESSEFAAAMGVASSADTLIRNFRRTPEVRQLAANAVDPKTQLGLLKRSIDLLYLKTDVRYQSPYDVAVSAYLFCLANARSAFFETVVMLTRSKGQFWWSPQLGEILESRNTNSATVAGTSSINENGSTEPSSTDTGCEVFGSLLDFPWNGIRSLESLSVEANQMVSRSADSTMLIALGATTQSISAESESESVDPASIFDSVA